MHTYGGFRFAGVLPLMGLIAGCSNPLWIPRDDGSSSVQTRVEVEFIPNATLVRENTSPRWHLGRFAFDEGPDRLLVVSRITSIGKSGQARTTGDDNRTDRILERVWITLSLGIPVGRSLSLEELESRFLIGYDAGLIDDAQFVQPSRVTGTISLVQEGPDEVIVDLDMLVQSQKFEPWRIIGKRHVPVVLAGVRATPVQSASSTIPATVQDVPDPEPVIADSDQDVPPEEQPGG